MNGRRAKYIKRQVRAELSNRNIQKVVYLPSPSFWQRIRMALRRWRSA